MILRRASLTASAGLSCSYSPTCARYSNSSPRYSSIVGVRDANA